ncbi:MAG TPA: hypothetical protein VLG09_00280 [Candidatus Saccharimonadales bacterium]|nr:hypothetical protein [Candidatus Saccharimonadales bacterium]
MTQKISGGFAAAALALLLCACGGGEDKTTSANTGKSATAPANSTSAPLPDQAVCKTFTAELVSQIIGKTVNAASESDGLGGMESPTKCYYFTDADHINNVTIQWTLEKDALWNQEVDAIGTADPDGNLPTVRVRYKGLGDEAIKETSTYEGDTVVTYEVLLKKRGVVVYVTNASDVSDAAQLTLTGVVIETTNKL